MRTITVEANGFRFAVDEEGEGDHLALCLHGFPESSSGSRTVIGESAGGRSQLSSLVSAVAVVLVELP